MWSGIKGGVEGGLEAVQGQLTAVGGVWAGGAAGVGAVRRGGVFGGVGVRLEGGGGGESLDTTTLDRHLTPAQIQPLLQSRCGDEFRCL